MIFDKEQFKKLRKQSRWSLSQLARFCGIDASTLSRWEAGMHVPSETYVRTLANILDVSVSEISDLPDNTQNIFLNGIKNLKKLANANEQKLQEKEEDFITQIKQQREQIKTQEILYVNKGYVNLFKPVPNTNKYDESWAYWLNNVVHPDDREEQLQYLAQSKFPKTRTYRIIHPQRGIRYMNAHISDPIIFYNRECKITITKDITDDVNKPQ